MMLKKKFKTLCSGLTVGVVGLLIGSIFCAAPCVQAKKMVIPVTSPGNIDTVILSNKADKIGIVEDPVVVSSTPDSSQTSNSGVYIYIPDSLQNDILKLLEGHSKVVDDQNKLDTKETTIFRGDTIPMVLKSLNLGRHDRGLYNFLYIPKGMLAIGMTASYGEFNTTDLELLGLVSDVSVGGHMFSIKPYLQYFIRNNLAVGVKFGYYNAKGNIDSFDLNIDDDMNFSLHDIMYRSNSFSGAITLTQYIGLTRRGRFGVFNEIELGMTHGRSTFRRPFGGVLRSTDTETIEGQLNFSPGLQVFIMKQVAFHVSFGVFGFNFKNERQTEDGVYIGKRFSSGANFRFNIFNINFGLAVTI